MLYYIINEDNEFLYSGQEFEGSTALDSASLPTTSSVTKIAPYDDNLVYWDKTSLPNINYSDSMTLCTIVDLSGIELTVDQALGSSYPLTTNGPQWNVSGMTTFTFPRKCSHIRSLYAYASGNYGFKNCTNLTTIKSVDYPDNHLPDLPGLVANFSGVFQGCSSLRSIVIHSLGNTKTLQATFGNCTLLNNVVFAADLTDVETFSAFSGCSSLREVYLPNMPNLNSMQGAFSNSGLRTLTIPNMSNNTVSLYAVCSGCTDLISVNIDINVNNLESAFNGCTDLTDVNISNTGSVTTLDSTFSGCTSLETVRLDDCSSVINMRYTFAGCTALTEIWLGSPKVIAVGGSLSSSNGWYHTFYNCLSLVTIHCSHLEYSGTGGDIFYNCPSLVGGNGTVWSSSHTGIEYTIVDGSVGNRPGYFTYDIDDSYIKVVTGVAGNVGIINHNYPGTNYKSGSTVELTFRPNAGYELDYWIKWNNNTHQFERIGDGRVLTLVANSDMLIIAIPKVGVGTGANFTVSLSSNNQQWGITVGSGAYPVGTNVIISARPAIGYIFVKWEELISGQWVYYSNNSNDTINSIGRNMTLRAVFMKANEPYQPVEPDLPGQGGQGTYDDSTDHINTDLYNSTFDEDVWNASATVYLPTRQQFEDFFDVLYGEAMKDKLSNMASNIMNMGVKPTDYIMKCYIYPVGINITGNTEYKFNMGWFDNLIYVDDNQQIHFWHSKIAPSRLDVRSFGTIHVDEYWGNALDYESTIQIYIPYVGYQPLDARTVMGKDLELKYLTDLTTGECIALVLVDGDVKYQFTGNMAYDIPVSMDNRSQQVLDNVGKLIKSVVGLFGGGN